jgi:calcineurin-like phosphoesterase family protein
MLMQKLQLKLPWDRIWFTSDTHFGHANIIRYCQRPFLNAEERAKLAAKERFKVSAMTQKIHDEALLTAINESAKPDDYLFNLGDMFWGDHEPTIFDYRKRINCKNVVLIVGNHDEDYAGEMAQAVYPQLLLEAGAAKLFLCHYPMKSWPHSHKGSWHLYGHVHGNLPAQEHELAVDVGVDSNYLRPLNMNDIADIMKPKIPKWEAWRARIKDKEDGGMKPGTNNLGEPNAGAEDNIH